MRDDFSSSVVDTLAKRVGMRCSNPGCRLPTSGPRDEPSKTVNVGVAAHITAASPGGPRYDPNLSSDERRSIENGIWLCQTCSKLIDNDPSRYTVNKLQEWKRLAEETARNSIQSPNENKEVTEGFETKAQIQKLVIPLNLDNSFSESNEELARISRQLLLALKAGNTIQVSCNYNKLEEYQNIIDDASDTAMDVVELSEYCRQKKLKAKYISDAVASLFSDPVQNMWNSYLVTEANWRTAFSGIFVEFSTKDVKGLTKIDVWRTTPPSESAPIFVSDEELTDILNAKKLTNKKHLAFGAGWISADELPLNIILRKVLPRILIALKAPWKEISAKQFVSALPLYSWHIGLG